MKDSLVNKAIILTGASAGIGRATAVALGREGAHVLLVARREDRLLEVAEQVRRGGGKAFVLALDLRVPGAVDAMVQEAVDRLGRVDVLINNAAFGYFGTVEHTPHVLVREIFELNFEVPLAAMQRVIPIMRKQGSGHIINISSVAGKRGLPLSGIYSATKFALSGVTESLRLELKDANIRVSVINPAGTESEFHEAIRRGDVEGKFKPMGHMQSAEEVGRAIVRCIRKPKLEVYPYWPSRLVAWVNAIAPSLVDAIMLPYSRDRMRARR